MAQFDPAFNKLMKIEGGFVDDPLDRGGQTKYGISHRAYPHLDIVSLTVEDAARIYRRDYWDRLQLDKIENQQIAEELFDSGVNCGRGNAAKWLQQSLNMIGGFAPGYVLIDGIIGPKTVQATNACRYPRALLKVLNGLQFMHYYRIVQNDRSQARFVRGWLRRVWEQ